MPKSAPPATPRETGKRRNGLAEQVLRAHHALGHVDAVGASHLAGGAIAAANRSSLFRKRLEVLPAFDHPEVWIRFPRQLGDVIFSIPFLHGLQQSWNAIAEAQGKKIRWVAVGHAIGAAIFSEASPDFIAESVIEAGRDQKPDPWALVRRWRSKPTTHWSTWTNSQSILLPMALLIGHLFSTKSDQNVIRSIRASMGRPKPTCCGCSSPRSAPVRRASARPSRISQWNTCRPNEEMNSSEAT